VSLSTRDLTEYFHALALKGGSGDASAARQALAFDGMVETLFVRSTGSQPRFGGRHYLVSLDLVPLKPQRPLTWSWWITRDEETYVDECATREAAIEAGLQYYDGDPFHIAECFPGSVSFKNLFEQDDLDEWAEDGFWPNADWVIGHFADRNEDAWGEDGFELRAMKREIHVAHRRLDAALAICPRTVWGINLAFQIWGEQHSDLIHVWAFNGIRNHEAHPGDVYRWVAIPTNRYGADWNYYDAKMKSEATYRWYSYDEMEQTFENA